MRVLVIFWHDDTSVVIDHVQMLKLVGPSTVVLQTFGNTETTHRNVKFVVPGAVDMSVGRPF
jgi:hypothetical protein